jgi:hypothetical protein
MNALDAIVPVLVVGMVVGVPMFALSIRIALKPVMEAWLKAREAQPPQRVRADEAELEALKLRVAALEVVWEQRLGAGTLQPSRTSQLVD